MYWEDAGDESSRGISDEACDLRPARARAGRAGPVLRQRELPHGRNGGDALRRDGLTRTVGSDQVVRGRRARVETSQGVDDGETYRSKGQGHRDQRCRRRRATSGPSRLVYQGRTLHGSPRTASRTSSTQSSRPVGGAEPASIVKVQRERNRRPRERGSRWGSPARVQQLHLGSGQTGRRGYAAHHGGIRGPSTPAGRCRCQSGAGRGGRPTRPSMSADPDTSRATSIGKPTSCVPRLRALAAASTDRGLWPIADSQDRRRPVDARDAGLAVVARSPGTPTYNEADLLGGSVEELFKTGTSSRSSR